MATSLPNCPQVSRIFLSILTDVINVVVCMVSILFFFCMVSTLLILMGCAYTICSYGQILISYTVPSGSPPRMIRFQFLTQFPMDHLS